MRAQQPVAGMSGSLNQSLVRQFRLPGYPIVMVSTDLLQEGEDLHTFCSTVLHYGLAWTPSAIEQRTGRIDRVRSATERRLTARSELPDGPAKLQVHYPHLEETVERLQVRRVLRRLDEFTRLMHTSLAHADRDDGRINIATELTYGDVEMPAAPDHVLRSAFEVRPRDVRGPKRRLAVDDAGAQLRRFRSLRRTIDNVRWEDGQPAADVLLGTAKLSNGRVQPLSLQLGWWRDALAIRCISPVGLVEAGDAYEALAAACRRAPIALGSVLVSDITYTVTVEEDVLLAAGDPDLDTVRVGALITRIAAWADALEYAHLSGLDQEMDAFRSSLERDVHHAR
jgi:hypothetical protein